MTLSPYSRIPDVGTWQPIPDRNKKNIEQIS